LAAALKNGEGKEEHDRFDLNNYDNRAIHWITALLMKHDIGTWPSTKDGTPLIGQRAWKFGSYGFQWVSTPSRIKLYAKSRDRGWTTRTCSNAATYAW
jgi:hypothetical protein